MSDYDKSSDGTTPNGPDNNDPEPVREFTFPGQDIHASWVLGAGKRDFFPDPEQQEWIPVLLKLKNTTALAFARGKTKGGDDLLGEGGRTRWLENVQVSRLFLRADEEPRATFFLTAMVKTNFLTDFLEARDVSGNPENPNLLDAVEAITISTPPTRAQIAPKFFSGNLAESDPEPLADIDLSGNPQSDGVVIIAVIDDGIAFGSERFWKAEADTRIEYVWLQDEMFEVSGGTPSSVFDYGRELTRNDINSALTTATAGGMVDEDYFYQHTGAVKFERAYPKSIAKRISHGSHVMDAAAGYDHRDATQQALAENRPIVCVQLPTDTTADLSGQNLEHYLADAIAYIVHCADLIARDRVTSAGTGTGPIPIVINFSYGHHLGAHNGKQAGEQAFEQAIADRMARSGVPLRVVVPSGNSHLSRTHAIVDFSDTVAEDLNWRIQPDGKTWSFMEIWLPPGSISPSRLSVVVTSPGGQATGPVSEGGARQTLPPSPTPPATEFCSVEHNVDANSGLSVFSIRIAPTERLAPHSQSIAPSGLWNVTLQPTANYPIGEVVDAWISRDGRPLGFSIYGRQSYFDHDCYDRYDDYGRPIEIDDPTCKIRRQGTINGLATGDGELIVVGGYLRKESRPSPYSAGGPTNSKRLGPDAMAVSDDSVVHRGRLAAGTRSGSTSALDGTSVAAPQITRWIAENLIGANLPDRSEVEANADPFAGQPLPDPRRGYGRIEMSPIVPQKRLED